jgi:hypothetical protein
MAFPGLGYRTVWSVMLEMGLALVEPYVYTTSASAVTTPGTATIQIGTLGYPVNACYIGAQLIIDSGLSQEIITVSAFDPTATPPTITATFSVPHLAGVQVIGVTFPTQAASGDFLFSQQEILSYIARAQNIFLSDVPIVFAISYQNIQVGQTLQPFPCNIVEAHRLASSAQNVALASLSRLNGVVTATSLSPHGLIPNEKFAIIQATDPNFDGAFSVATVPDNLHWTYAQAGANESVSGGGMAGLWLRLLECSQEELALQNPFFAQQALTSLHSWYEDRAGLYQWGIGGRPATNVPVEILCSIRDSDTLQMNDGFLVPDVCLHAVRWLALKFCLEKAGEQRDASRAQYCEMRYKKIVMAVRRWSGWAGGLGGQAQQQMAMAGSGGGKR